MPFSTIVTLNWIADDADVTDFRGFLFKKTE
jgi:hypothetical protein